ncbi:MAG: hypothetical protein K9L61_00320 [Candidatus Omnitrophica bacterium]|nr:hypothetical protein [Candidatus Omnitrophota bacterium]
MNKKGIALAIVLWIVAIFSVIIASLFIRVLNERNLVKRHINTVKSFWLAEAGLSEAFVNFPNSVSTTNITQNQGCPAQATCSYQVTTTKISDSDPNNDYYTVNSIGIVVLATGAQLETNLEATVKTDPPDPSKFQHAIETTGDLVTKGSAYTIEGTINEQAILNFSNLFSASKDTIKSNAAYLYTEDNFAEPVDGITWVEVSSGEELTTAGNLQGSGILVVAGDCHISGTENFNGILYVIGELTITGTPTLNGTVLAESATDIDTTIKGHVTINYDPDAISNALNNIEYLSKEIIAWQQ